jgi:hypothetical protein
MNISDLSLSYSLPGIYFEFVGFIEFFAFIELNELSFFIKSVRTASAGQPALKFH